MHPERALSPPRPGIKCRGGVALGLALVLTTLAPLAGDPITHSAVLRPTITPTPAATPTATAVSPAGGVQNPLVFFLYAARVSTPHNSGDLSGLAAVQRGATVWLMMYYVVKNIPKVVTRTTRYTLEHEGKTVFDVLFHGNLRPSDAGHYVRYTAFTVPDSLQLGRYVLRVTLVIAGKAETKTWSFAVGLHSRLAGSASSSGSTSNLTGQASFLLYAARVSTVNIAGNLSGLTTVHRGMTVWLTMFYTVTSVPASVPRIARYAVLRGGTTVFRATSYGKVDATTTGRLSLHTIYTLPRSLPYGAYTFRATLTLGKKTQTRMWRFAVTEW